MNGAERRRRIFLASPFLRTPAQSRAEIEPSRARGLSTDRCEFSPATPMRTAAHASKKTRSLAAYGAPKLMAEPLAQPQPPEDMGVVSHLPSSIFCGIRESQLTQRRTL